MIMIQVISRIVMLIIQYAQHHIQSNNISLQIAPFCHHLKGVSHSNHPFDVAFDPAGHVYGWVGPRVKLEKKGT